MKEVTPREGKLLAHALNQNFHESSWLQRRNPRRGARGFGRSLQPYGQPFRCTAILAARTALRAPHVRLFGRREGDVLSGIEHERDAAGVFQPMIFQDTGARFLRRASQRNFRLADLEVYVFHRKVHGIDRA